jgi:hypothetical protein
MLDEEDMWENGLVSNRVQHVLPSWQGCHSVCLLCPVVLVHLCARAWRSIAAAVVDPLGDHGNQVLGLISSESVYALRLKHAFGLFHQRRHQVVDAVVLRGGRMLSA